MFSSLARIELNRPRAARIALQAAILGGICAGQPAEAHAQGDVKKAIVKIVTSGTRILGSEEAQPDQYVGSGFIVYSKESNGEAETVIVTADHVLGYSQSDKITFKEGEVENPPPVWLNQNDPRCEPQYRGDGGTSGASAPCRSIEIFYLDRGQWVSYKTAVHIHWQGDRNRDAAVLRLKFAHDDQRGLEVDSELSLDEAARRLQRILPPFTAWGIETRNADKDPSLTPLTYRWRNDGPTLLFTPSVEPGNSGGPVLFEGKVIGIISAVQSGDTRVTNISTVEHALRNWNIQADRVPASYLARQIRCETRHAITRILIEWLGALGDRGDPIAQRLAQQYRSDPGSIGTLSPDLFKEPFYAAVRTVINLFYSVGIAYSFESKPRFTVTDTFRGLLTNLDQPGPDGRRYCDGVVAGSDYGRTGVDRLVRDFVELSVFGGLAEAGKRAPPTLVDVLNYLPRGGRTNKSTVTVALAISPTSSVMSAAKNGGLNSSGSSVMVGKRVTGRGNTASETLALMAIDQGQ